MNFFEDFFVFRGDRIDREERRSRFSADDKGLAMDRTQKGQSPFSVVGTSFIGGILQISGFVQRFNRRHWGAAVNIRDKTDLFHRSGEIRNDNLDRNAGVPSSEFGAVAYDVAKGVQIAVPESFLYHRIRCPFLRRKSQS